MEDELMTVKHPTYYLDTMINLLKGSCGTGLYAMGDAFKNSGLLLGVIFMAFLGVICTYANHELINASNKLKETLNLQYQPDFPETVNLVFTSGPESIQKFGPPMRTLTIIFLGLSQFGFCCVYIVFAASTFEQVLEYFGHTIDIHLLMIAVIIPILLSCLIRDLRHLAPVSLVANILLFGSALACIIYAVQDLPSISERELANWKTVPLFFGTSLFSLTITGMIMPFAIEMANPSDFNKTFGVLNVSSFIFVTLYIIMGFLCYLKWGDEIHGSVTLNLDQTKPIPQCIKVATALAIMFTYAIQFYVPFVIIWPSCCKRFGPFQRPLAAELGLRVTLVMITFVLAEAIPFLGLLISLVGALCTATLALLIPPTLDFVMQWRMSLLTPWVVLKNIIVIVVGLLGAITGTYMSILAIVNSFDTKTGSKMWDPFPWH